ncbi:phosphohistidine phosphatase SixA [Alteromonas facilis]|uniref:phosphohistidine phosphatase SixA n=1 Tax=Alteromonas facilis TaxID=2048004 RepID=UPI0013DB95FB|nr:phosphohistidine phosphatase SixA [Alteromonas facilis]
MHAQGATSTRVIIVRHGEAEAALLDDKSRQLTDRGRKQTTQASIAISQFVPHKKFDIAFVSPYRRAQQTFDVLSVRLATKQRVECEDITPMSSPVQASHMILGYTEDPIAEKQCILVVSHMPLVSFLTAELANLESPPIFSTSAFAVIDIDNNNGFGHLVDLVHQHD